MGRLIFAALVGAVVACGVVPVDAARFDLASGQPVDVALVLAVDASASMSDESRKMQRDGYANALTSNAVLRAIQQGENHQIAVAYFEWGSADEQALIAPWTIVNSDASARALADKIRSAPSRNLQSTSISAALQYAGALIAQSGLTAKRRVIDVSGDGPNNNGPTVSELRDEVVAQGVTINGLPIVTPSDNILSIPDLDDYYDQCVIGGDGSFLIPVRGMANFGKALEMKLVLEIAGLAPALRAVPAKASRFAGNCGN